MCNNKDPLEGLDLDQAEPWEVDKALFTDISSLSDDEANERVNFSHAFKEYYDEIHSDDDDD